MTDSSPMSGSTLAIGTTQADVLSDTYQVIGEITNFGEIGRVYELAQHAGIAERGTEKHKTSYNDGDPSFDMALDADDQGQVDADAAIDSDLDYNFRISLNDASGDSGSHVTFIYFKAKITGFPYNLSGDIAQRRLNLANAPGTIQVIPAT